MRFFRPEIHRIEYAATVTLFARLAGGWWGSGSRLLMTGSARWRTGHYSVARSSTRRMTQLLVPGGESARVAFLDQQNQAIDFHELADTVDELQRAARSHFVGVDVQQ